MEKYICDEKNGFWYELPGDDYLPCLTLPANEELRCKHIHLFERFDSLTETVTARAGTAFSGRSGFLKKFLGRQLIKAINQLIR